MQNEERFASVDYENKGELVYTQLAHALMQGKLLPGERLKIRELADRMGTSVTPVRDAILRLVQDGALVMLSARDIRVRELSLDEYLEIRRIRVELEGIAASQAAQHATPDNVTQLRDMLATHERAVRANLRDEAIAANQNFHFALCHIGKLPQLAEILRRLWLKVGPLIAQCYPEAGRDIIDHHYPAVDAIARGDELAAKVAMQTDIVLGGQSMLEALMEGRSVKAGGTTLLHKKL